MGPVAAVKSLLSKLPQGSPLPDEVWAKRHRGILTLLWLHVPAVWAFAMFRHVGPVHAAVEAAAVLAFAVAAAGAPRVTSGRRTRMVLTAMGLLTASAVLVHLSHGLIEMHFHFFVMVGVVTLYQDWWPFLTAIGYVVGQHGIAGAIAPTDVFNHDAAIAHPWRWATVHGVFILGMSAAGIVTWRLNEALLAAAADREQRLAEAQHVARLGSWEWDLRGGRVTWSDEMYRLGGMEPGAFEPSRQTVLSRIHESDRALVAAAIDDTAATGTANALDFRILRADGDVRWVHGRWTVSEWADGVPVVISGTSQDISDRRHAEERQAETLSLLAATLDATADGILVVDANGKITSFNKQFATMWRIPAEVLASGDDDAALGHVLGQLVDAEGFIAKVRELYAHPDAESHDTITFTDGRSFERYSKPQRVDGEIVGRVWSFSDMTERRRLEVELAHQAFHDPLTNLANKALFRNRVEHALALCGRTDREVAVVFVDLDHFKTINDSLGHTAGDELLTVIAARIAEVVRAGDTAARLGGDEFAILMEDADSREDVEAMVQRILSRLRKPVEVAGLDMTVTASIGIAFDGALATVDKILANADLAMYTAKGAGRNRYEIFVPGMDTAAVERLELANDLRRACSRGEIVVHYQPIVALDTGAMLGVEALVRWDHPTRGLLAPAAFLTVAEETGIVGDIGRIVLFETCRQLREWEDAGASLRASVNLSGRQLAERGLVSDVVRALGMHGIAADRLTLELTESCLMENTEHTITTLRELKTIGVALAVDDFGTGYSSLSYLQRFPIDVLKIDRSFIADIGLGSTERSLAQAIVTLAGSLGLTAVAEGIETADQAQLLAQLGCELAQGYHWSRPVPAAGIVDLLRAPAMSVG